MARILVWMGCALATAGCTGVELARLAPPGIIRYERIADEKEPNPAIVERIAEREETEQPRFPKIGDTAAGGARMTAIPNGEVSEEIRRLESQRDRLDMALQADKFESDAAAADAAAINEAAAALSVAVDDAKKASEREREENRGIDTANEK